MPGTHRNTLLAMVLLSCGGGSDDEAASCGEGTELVDGECVVVDSDGGDGSDGTDGSAGSDGSDGADGMDGTDGADGSDGTDGSDGADGSDGGDPPRQDVVSLVVYPCWSEDGRYHSDGWIELVDEYHEVVGRESWDEADHLRPFGVTFEPGYYYRRYEFDSYANGVSHAADGQDRGVERYDSGTYRRWYICDLGGGETSGFFTEGVDYVADEVWIEFETGLTSDYAETLLSGVNYTIVTQTMESPPAYIVRSEDGLPAPAATLDITSSISRIAFAEPNPL